MTVRQYLKLPKGANPASPLGALFIVLGLILCARWVGQEWARPLLFLTDTTQDTAAIVAAFGDLPSDRLGLFLLITCGVPLLGMLVWVRCVEACGGGGVTFAGLRSLGGGFASGVVLIMVVSFIHYALALVVFYDIAWPSGWRTVWPLLVLLCGWCIQAMYEEMVFRGYLLPRLATKWGWWPSVAVSSVLFALAHAFNAHMNPLFLLNLILFSVFACLLVRRTKTIWHICGLHAGWNFAQAHLVGRPVSGMLLGQDRVSDVQIAGPIYLSGGYTGLEGSVVTSVIFVGLCVYFLHWEKPRVRERS